MSRPMLALFLAAIAGSATTPGARAEPRPAPVDPCARAAMRSDPAPVLPFGCATEANLGAMVADPADLQQGRASTPGRGDAAFAAAKRHRLGQVKPLIGAAGSQGGAGGSPAATQAGKGY